MANEIIIAKHPEYDDAYKTWLLVEDACGGEYKVKKRGVVYLPMPNPDDESKGNKLRYEQYKTRAVYYNTCFRTLMGMVGVAFRVPPKEVIPASIDYLTLNADGSGLSLQQQAQWVLSEVIKKGRCGVMVDYPMVAGDTSKADVQRGIRSTIKTYSAEQVIDWNEEKTETGTRLNYVKMCEISRVLDIQTGLREEVKRYIVLRLDEGVYTVQHYNDLSHAEDDPVTPLNASGKPFDYIPFMFVGSENNNPDIDQALLYDLAVVNVAHYRNSADNEEASFIAGQPTLAVTSSMNGSDWKEHNPSGVQIGARKGHFLGESGSLSMVQAQPNNLPRELMKDKEAQMVSLGAQLVTPTSQETATATSMKLASNTSALSLAVGNVSDAYATLMTWANEFMSSNVEETLYSINTDFFPAQLGAAELQAWVAGVQGDTLPASALYAQMRDAGLTQLTDEEILAEIDSSSKGIDLG
ncbi:MAG: putative portal protein [Prokaryotic dsDNA virus sp.]|nr:hypothetical protein [Phycisphaerae bacterium]QDP45969.1 MAG: putative portal protein [Prokaryotic dsDNA virus sp.]|tara:strand:+ start:1278 stop:2681 length:1404 start_codon:yes stop_codon:yes gene_type:complete